MSETVTAAEPQIDIAAALAKGGVKTDDSPVTIPVQDTPPAKEVTQEVQQPEPVKAEIAKPTPASESPKEEPSSRPGPAETPPERASTPVQPESINWQDVIKKQPEVEVMKAMGLDEKMINFLSRWRGGEDLKDYLEAATVDYSKMSPEELLRRQLHKEFGSLSAEDFEEVYKMKVTEQYKLDPDLYDEKEVRRGRLLLGVDAEKVRQEFIKRQQELLLSKPPEPGPSQADIEAQAKQAQNAKDFETYKGLVQSNQYAKELLSTNLLKIGDGEKAFNLEIAKPSDILDLLYDPVKWTAKLWNEDGTPNVRKQLILSAIANDDELFFNNLAKHYQKLGEKALAEKIENPSEPSIGVPAKGSAESNDPIAQLAKFGTITSG